MSLSTLEPYESYQQEYQSAVEDIKKCLVSGVGNNLHSLYLYGSVARRTARPHHSDLNLIIVTQDGVGDNWSTVFNTIKWRFQKEFPFITEVNLKKGVG